MSGPSGSTLDPRLLRGIQRARAALLATDGSWRAEDDDERSDAHEAAAAADAALALLEQARWYEAEAEADHALEVCEAWGRIDFREVALLVHEVCELARDLAADDDVP